MAFTLTCQNCGDDFEVVSLTGRSGQRKHCSRKCRSEAARKKHVRTCKQCGAEFNKQVPPSHQSRGRGQYCSKECAGVARRDRAQKFCEQCGKEFEVEGNRSAAKFCSTQCHNDARRTWKGMDAHGYIVASVDGEPVRQHRLVMEEHLGRHLKPNENVHHKNGVRHDNRIENLELWTKSQPPGGRVEDKIAWAKEFLEEYGYTVHEPTLPHQFNPPSTRAILF